MHRRSSLFGRAILYAAVSGVLAGCFLIARQWFGPNFHIVIPGKVFRSAQPTAQALEDYTTRHGLRTVINLRGPHRGRSWYDTEVETAERLKLSLVDLPFTRHHLPSMAQLRQLVDLLEQTPGPVLIHCRYGGDPTAAASAAARLLAGDSLREARREFNLWYGSTSMGVGWHLPRFLDLYQEWLLESERAHSPDSFRSWVDEVESLHYFAARLDSPSFPTEITPEKAWSFAVRVTNSSRSPWPIEDQPMKLLAEVFDVQGKPIQQASVGLERETLPPQQSTEATMLLSPLDVGEYTLSIDIDDGCGVLFSEMGVKPWTKPFRIEPTRQLASSAPHRQTP